MRFVFVLVAAAALVCLFSGYASAINRCDRYRDSVKRWNCERRVGRAVPSATEDTVERRARFTVDYMRRVSNGRLQRADRAYRSGYRRTYRGYYARYRRSHRFSYKYRPYQGRGAYTSVRLGWGRRRRSYYRRRGRAYRSGYRRSYRGYYSRYRRSHRYSYKYRTYQGRGAYSSVRLGWPRRLG